MSTPPTLTLDEESRAILRRIVESLAWRQLASIHLLGHGLKFVTELDVKKRVVGELTRALEQFESVRALYGELGWTELESAVRERLENLAYPESRLEFGLAYYVSGLSEDVVMRAYVDSSWQPFATIARRHVEAWMQRPEPTRFQEYSSEPRNRPHAQELVERWVPFARRAFGRSDSPYDEKAVKLGLKSKRAAELDASFCERLKPLLSAGELSLPV